MNAVIAKTLGGLDNRYYFRQFVFGVAVAAVVFYFLSRAYPESGPPMTSIVFGVISTLLYPYSRFVYEQIAGFIFGENVIYGNATTMFGIKFITMFFCWLFAILIAPIGLAYLYYHHSK